MAIAVFGDIHGNLEALEAILRHIKRNRKIKKTFFLGDAIMFGPDSSACLKLLKKSKVECLAGNHEQRVSRYDKSAETRTYADAEHIEYVFKTLTRDDLNFIRLMPIEQKIHYKGFDICFTHYSHDKAGTLREETDEFSELKLKNLFSYTKCNVVFFGHLHARKLIIDEQGDSFICNGSSGCVHGEHTFYTYFDVNETMGDDPNFDIYKVNIKFNRKRFVEKMEKTPLPGKEVYAKFCFGTNFDKRDN
ncbi:MAG: metallophosphoesterase family protein [Christensenellaceae bacterium]|jgi:predicted phosphodiesterase|nr:metallophosphoesterase family protein [Christensenellaceae bacterium]